MGVAGWEPAVGSDLVQVVGIDDLEDGLVEVQSVVAGVPLDLVLQDPQVGRQVGVVKHGAVLAGGRRAGPNYTLPVPFAIRKEQDEKRRASRARTLPTRAQELFDRPQDGVPVRDLANDNVLVLL